MSRMTTDCSKRNEWFHGPSSEPVLEIVSDCGRWRERSRGTKHDVASTDEDDGEVISTEGCDFVHTD